MNHDDTTPQKSSEARAVADIVQDLYRPHVLTVKGQEGQAETQVLILPDGNGGLSARGVKEFLDPYRAKPERRKGNADFTDLDSLIQHVNRFKDSDSALFAKDDRAAPAIQAVLDYHRAGHESDPRFGQHRARYSFPLSDEWQAWRNVDGEAMEQMEFAEFLEDRIIDVMHPPAFLTEGTDPNAAGAKGKPAELTDSDAGLRDMVEKIGGKVCGPSKLMELSKGLRIHDQQKMKEVVNTATGEVQIQFESEHQDAEGRPIKVPNLFLLAIPVFHNGPLYRVPVRLRYRARTGRIAWHFTMHRPDLIQDHAFSEACERAGTETELPLFYGTPEA
jgi:hypothetical protein